MKKQNIYKIDERQFNLIVEQQKKQDPQLQTEAFEALADAFGKLLTSTFKGTVNVFKYFTGIRVNVFRGGQFSKSGKVPVKKNNILAPLSLYKPELQGLPKNFEKLFVSLNGGINNISQEIDTPEEEKQADSIVENTMSNLVFDDVKQENPITYPIKFEFQNINKEHKVNQAIMMTTWNLAFTVTSDKKDVTEQSTLTFNLFAFSSQGPSIERMLSSLGKNKEDQDLFKFMNISSRIAQGSSPNEFSLIFSDQGQASKFARVMEKQIKSHMKILVEQLNYSFGVRNIIKVPNIVVKVENFLIGDVQLQTSAQPMQITAEEIDNDINEINRQINLYKNNNQYKDYIQQLNYIKTKLELRKKMIKK